MTAKISASADGLKVTIGNAAEDALEIDQTAKTIKGINGYSLNGNGPAFFVTSASTTTPTTSTTAVDFNAKVFDTDDNFDLTTDRFTATVAGYYQVNATLQAGVVTVAGTMQCIIRKNGAEVTQSLAHSSASFTPRVAVSTVIDLAIGDFLELFGRNTLGANFGVAQFSGAWLRPL
jgi:hypothetical protein